MHAGVDNTGASVARVQSGQCIADMVAECASERLGGAEAAADVRMHFLLSRRS